MGHLPKFQLYAYIVASGLLVSACASFKGPEQTLEGAGPVATSSDGMIGVFRETYAASRADRENPTKAQEFLEAGLQLVKSNCDEFFHDIGRFRQRLSSGQRLFALGSATAGAAMGLTGASATAIALLSAGIAGSLGASEIYGDVHLFGPDTAAVQQLVATAQQRYITEIDNDLKAGRQLNFFSAYGFVQEFQNICQVQRIQSMVNVAITQGRVRRDIDSELSVLALNSTIQRSVVAREAGVAQLSDIELRNLYWLLVHEPSATTQERQNPIQAQIARLNLLTESGELKTDAATNRRVASVRTALLGLPPESRSELARQIEEIRTQRAGGTPRRRALRTPAAPLAVTAPPPARALPGRIILRVE